MESLLGVCTEVLRGMSQGANARGLGCHPLQAHALPNSRTALAPFPEEEGELLSSTADSRVATGAADAVDGRVGGDVEHLAVALMEIVHKINAFKDKLETAYKALQHTHGRQHHISAHQQDELSHMRSSPEAGSGACATLVFKGSNSPLGKKGPGLCSRRNTQPQENAEVVSPGAGSQKTANTTSADLVAILTYLLKAGQANAAHGGGAGKVSRGRLGADSVGPVPGGSRQRAALLQNAVPNILSRKTWAGLLEPAMPGSHCSCAIDESAFNAILCQRQQQEEEEEQRQRLMLLLQQQQQQQEEEKEEQQRQVLMLLLQQHQHDAAAETHRASISARKHSAVSCNNLLEYTADAREPQLQTISSNETLDIAPSHGTNCDELSGPVSEKHEAQGSVRPIRDGHRLGTDGYGWKKYSHKVLKGRKLKRHYYACSARVKHQCPARKIVDRVLKGGVLDRNHDTVKFEGKHNHPPIFQHHSRASKRPCTLDSTGVRPKTALHDATTAAKATPGLSSGLLKLLVDSIAPLEDDVKPATAARAVHKYQSEDGLTAERKLGNASWISRPGLKYSDIELLTSGMKRRASYALEDTALQGNFSKKRLQGDLLQSNATLENGHVSCCQDDAFPGTPARDRQPAPPMFRRESSPSPGPKEADSQSRASLPNVEAALHLNVMRLKQGSLGIAGLSPSPSAATMDWEMVSVDLQRKESQHSLSTGVTITRTATERAALPVDGSMRGASKGNQRRAEHLWKQEPDVPRATIQEEGKTRSSLVNESPAGAETKTCSGQATVTSDTIELPDSSWSDTVEQYFVEPTEFNNLLD